jgi:hypothetical protein
MWHPRFAYCNQIDATISSAYYLTFIYSSTCFGRPHAHHQELNNCSSSLWCYFRRDAPKIKPDAATAVVELLMMGMRTSETCWAVNKRQVINWRNRRIWLVDLFQSHTAFARAGHLFINRGRRIYFTSYFKFTLILSKHLPLNPQSKLFPSQYCLVFWTSLRIRQTTKTSLFGNMFCSDLLKAFVTLSPSKSHFLR